LPEHVTREKNVIQKIFQDHFSDFEQKYDDHYAQRYGKFRIIRIKEAVEKFLECGDYTKEVARINAQIKIVNTSISALSSLRSK